MLKYWSHVEFCAFVLIKLPRFWALLWKLKVLIFWIKY